MGSADDGRPDRRHVTGRTEREVTRKVRDLERARDAGHATAPGRAPTVASWLAHWVEKVAGPSVRPKTLAGYRTAVYKHLTPLLGAHRLDRLSPEHIEAAYATMTASGLAAATVHQTHRTLRTALGEARARGRIAVNPAALARPPRLDDAEIVPLSVAEARAILTTAEQTPNGTRYAIALALGLRQGEALGLAWDDVALDTETEQPTMITVRQALQRHTWQHGCSPTHPCGRKRGADCPQRHGGGLHLGPPKSRAGRRAIVLPEPLADALRAHRKDQLTARLRAGQLWEDHGLVFCQPTGRPLDPRADLRDWKRLLAAAGVRDARLHDARHTAATLLLVQGVDARTVMDLLGWSHINMTRRYQHVVDELRTEAARRVSAALWPEPNAHPTSAAVRTRSSTSAHMRGTN